MDNVALPDDATNVLLLTDEGDEALSICVGTVTAATRFLAVSYTRWASEYADRLAGVSPAEIVVIRAQREDISSDPEGVTVCTEAPDNLTGIGVRTNEFLTRWHSGADPVVVYFDSITALLQYAELDMAYRFLHVLRSRVTHSDATGFYHLAPGAHDEATVATFKQLFDTVLLREDDGTYRLAQR